MPDMDVLQAARVAEWTVRTSGITIREAADTMNAVALVIREFGEIVRKNLSLTQRASLAVDEWCLIGPPLAWVLWNWDRPWYTWRIECPDDDQT